MIERVLEAYANSNQSEEVGGVIIEDGGKAKFVPLENCSHDRRNQMKISSGDYLKYYQSIIAIFHTHIEDEGPSEMDISTSNELQIPYIIFSLPTKSFYYIRPKKTPKYLDRTFLYGINDCYTLVQDIYKNEHGVILNDYKTPWGWWKGGKSEFLANMEKEGFVLKDEPKNGDVVLMSTRGDVVDHIGYYENQDIIHQMFFCASKRERLAPMEGLVYGYARHKKFC